MRSSCSFKKNQPSPMANANGMVFNSYLRKNYDRNCQSSPDSYILMISCSCGKLPGCTTPYSAHSSCTHMHHFPHCVPNPLWHHSSLASMWKMSNCAIFLKHLYNIIAKPPMHGHPNIFSTVPLLTFLALALTMLNSLLLCSLNFKSSTILSWLSFR